MYIWVTLKESVKLVRILWRKTEICSNPGFLLERKENYRPELLGNMMQKHYLLGPMTWKVTRRNVWKDNANLQIKRLNKYTKSQHHAWMTIILKKKKMSQWENWLQFVHKLFCSELSVFGSYWETWYIVVREQTCSCGHKVDEILWQTLGSFDLLHSSCKWIPAILLCGKHSTTMQTMTVSGLWFCRRSWGL